MPKLYTVAFAEKVARHLRIEAQIHDAGLIARKRAAIRLLAPEIAEASMHGYRVRHMARLLGKRGLDIKERTLRAYLRKISRTSRDQSSPRAARVEQFPRTKAVRARARSRLLN